MCAESGPGTRPVERVQLEPVDTLERARGRVEAERPQMVVEAVGEVERLDRALRAVGLPVGRCAAAPRAQVPGVAAAPGHRHERERERPTHAADLLARLRRIAVVDVAVGVRVRPGQVRRARRQPAARLEVDGHWCAARQVAREPLPDERGSGELDHVLALQHVAGAGVHHSVVHCLRVLLVGHPPRQPAAEHDQRRHRAVAVDGLPLSRVRADQRSMRTDVVLDRAHGLPRLDLRLGRQRQRRRRRTEHAQHPAVRGDVHPQLVVGDRHAVDRLRPVDGRDPARQSPAPAGRRDRPRSAPSPRGWRARTPSRSPAESLRREESACRRAARARAGTRCADRRRPPSAGRARAPPGPRTGQAPATALPCADARPSADARDPLESRAYI